MLFSLKSHSVLAYCAERESGIEKMVIGEKNRMAFHGELASCDAQRNISKVRPKSTLACEIELGPHHGGCTLAGDSFGRRVLWVYAYHRDHRVGLVRLYR